MGGDKEGFQRGGEPDGTKERPVKVTGDPAVHGASTMEEKRRRISVETGDKIPMEFDSKDCDIDEWKTGTLVSTVGMKKVMESFGGFPASYYVRQEEINVFKTIGSRWKESWSGITPLEPYAVLGSPGVGKSVFVVFLAFYMARLRSRSVLLLRQLKGAEEELKCVVLSKNSYRGIEVPSLFDFGYTLSSLRREVPGLLCFLDGFSSEEIKRHCLFPYRLLATSSEYDRKDDDPANLIVLPAWQFCDLADFGKQTKIFKSDADAKDVYYYSGGSLREFCRDISDMKDRVDDTLNKVGDSGQALTLMGGNRGASGTQVDRLRRRYLNDSEDLEQYKWVNSKYVVDSGYVLQRLLRRCDKEQYEKLYNFAKAFCGAFHGWEFEFYLHKLAISSGFIIEAKKYGSADRPVQYEIKCSEPTSEGTSESKCMASLDSWASNVRSKYWYPQYSRFPNIDCVVKMANKTTGEKVLAYVQITVAEAHKLDGAWMDKLDEVFKKHHYKERIYIAIQPKNVVSAQRLTLSDPEGGPVQTRVPLYEAYFEGPLLD